jgi:hypothetical protein
VCRGQEVGNRHDGAATERPIDESLGTRMESEKRATVVRVRLAKNIPPESMQKDTLVFARGSPLMNKGFLRQAEHAYQNKYDLYQCDIFGGVFESSASKG